MTERTELDAADFIWNDGGRAASGFVGHTGDCVTRAIAIATGRAYREVYEEFKSQSGHSPRNGIGDSIYGPYLAERGWVRTDCGSEKRFQPLHLPKGVLVARLQHAWNLRIRGHLCCVIDRVIHDTWNPAEDEYEVVSYWTHPALCEGGSLPAVAPKRSISKSQEMTQAEFDKVLRRLRALDRTARNDASTEAERRNALRAIQTMMFANNLTRDDILEEDNVEGVSFGRIACILNGTRACKWESNLAAYLCREVFTSVQYYLDSKNKRSTIVFYGPINDVRNTIQLYREMLLTIACLAQSKYGGYARGSGASYCEGYVKGLPRNDQPAGQSPQGIVSSNSLIETRMCAIKSTAKDWLREECGITLWTSSGSRRSKYDPVAESRGKVDGSKHQIDKPAPIRNLTFRPPGLK